MIRPLVLQRNIVQRPPGSSRPHKPADLKLTPDTAPGCALNLRTLLMSVQASSAASGVRARIFPVTNGFDRRSSATTHNKHATAMQAAVA